MIKKGEERTKDLPKWIPELTERRRRESEEQARTMEERNIAKDINDEVMEKIAERKRKEELEAFYAPVVIEGVYVKKWNPTDSTEGEVVVSVYIGGKEVEIYRENVFGSNVGHYIPSGGIRARLTGNLGVSVEEV